MAGVDHHTNDLDCSRRCKSYFAFKGLLRETMGKYLCLDPTRLSRIPQLMRPGSEGELNESGTEFIRGGIVALMTVWENYVHELFDEAFDTLITICSGPNRSLQRLEEQWPGCKDIIKREMKNKNAYKLMKDTEQRSEKMWMKLLNAHRRSILDEITFMPIFNYMAKPDDKAMTIDSLFMKLFETTPERGNVSHMLVNVAKQTEYFRYFHDEYDLMVTLHPTDGSVIKALCNPRLYYGLHPKDGSAVKALRNISRLYYGLRCVLVHGRKEITLQRGVLSEFPEEEEDFLLPDQEDKDIKARVYTELYKGIKDKGRNTQMDYLTFRSFAAFISYAAQHLMEAVAEWIYAKQPQNSRIPVWGWTIQQHPIWNHVLLFASYFILPVYAQFL